MRTGILIILLLCIQVGIPWCCHQYHAGDFSGNQENTEIQLITAGDVPSLVQSWVDEGYQFLAGNQRMRTLYWYRR